MKLLAMAPFISKNPFGERSKPCADIDAALDVPIPHPDLEAMVVGGESEGTAPFSRARAMPSWRSGMV